MALSGRLAVDRQVKPSLIKLRAPKASVSSLRTVRVRLSEAHHFDTLADTAGDIEALADWLGLDRFTLAGYSGGAPHALAAALLMGDRIERVALISPVGLVADGAHVPMTSVQHFIFSYLGHSQFAARMYFHGVRSMMAWLPGGAEMLVTQYASASDRAILCRPGLRELLDLTMHEGLGTSVDGAVQDLRLYCRPWGLPLHELETPAHIWQGAADTIVAPEAAYQLAKALPNCTLEVLQDMGHYWLFGAFEGILETIREKPRRFRTEDRPANLVRSFGESRSLIAHFRWRTSTSPSRSTRYCSMEIVKEHGEGRARRLAGQSRRGDRFVLVLLGGGALGEQTPDDMTITGSASQPATTWIASPRWPR